MKKKNIENRFSAEIDAYQNGIRKIHQSSEEYNELLEIGKALSDKDFSKNSNKEEVFKKTLKKSVNIKENSFVNEIIRMEKVNKSYSMGEESLHVLKDISLTVEKGDYLTILGPSGSGKTTLMNILGCMDTLDIGTYQLEDMKVDKCTNKELSWIRNQKIGFIFQKYNLIPQYTALQNIIMPLLLRGMSREEALNKADEYISLVGLSDRILHKPKELSGGQQQRVAIARALVTEPALLLADEPTGSLDSTTGKDILALFQKLNDNGNTIIVISHDNKVAQQSKRIVSIFDGEIAV